MISVHKISRKFHQLFHKRNDIIRKQNVKYWNKMKQEYNTLKTICNKERNKIIDDETKQKLDIELSDQFVNFMIDIKSIGNEYVTQWREIANKNPVRVHGNTLFITVEEQTDKYMDDILNKYHEIFYSLYSKGASTNSFNHKHSIESQRMSYWPHLSKNICQLMLNIICDNYSYPQYVLQHIHNDKLLEIFKILINCHGDSIHNDIGAGYEPNNSGDKYNHLIHYLIIILSLSKLKYNYYALF
eukprot:150807_1